ncbi:MAG: choice-of-anchor J domain-containing protein [Dysgonamonadaceae bacterium]|jgi:hypothetical protein|nr:choice-of-anchor J domain-containing protein [Dysgonamonadaceae bacterium]
MKKIFYTIAVALLVMTSCQDWNESNFPGYLDDKSELNPVDSVITLGKTEIAAIVKMMQDKEETLTGSDSTALSNLAKALKNSEMFPTTDDAHLWITNYFYSVFQPANGKLSIDPGSEIVAEYRLFANPDSLKADIRYTLVDEDYDAMGTASGYPGRYHNFDAKMGHTEYLTTFLAQKYPYAKTGVKIALTYQFYTESSYGTKAFTEVFIKTENGWAVQSLQDRFKMLPNRSWEYVNTLILAKTFLDGGLAPFVAYDVDGNGVNWTYDATYGAKMTEYASGANHAGEDWLVSPAMDFSERNVARVVFESAARYQTADQLSVYVSTTYTDGATPDVAAWTRLNITVPDNRNWTFVKYQLSLDAVCGQPNVHIAFRYISTDSAAGTWEVKNLIVEAVPVDE